MRWETRADYEGVGVYERLEEGPRLSDEFRYGVYSMTGLGALPGATELLAPLLQTEERSGLVVVRQDAKPAALQALSLLHFQRTSAPGADPVIGQASYVLGSLPSGWVETFVSQGYMVMVSRSSIPTGNVAAMITRSPQIIAASATKEGGYVMVDGPAELAVAAMQLRLAATQPACPGGTAWSPAQNQCLPIPGGVEDGRPAAEPVPPAAVAAAKAPSWIVPAAVAVGVVLVGAVLLKA